ncbi:MAG: hypothetical protein KJ630_19590 [Proteobacteria bacterium]|nr:hypothetical protein [Pseudomonadota bacterium]
MARIVALIISHHITQRGNRRQETFFKDEEFFCRKLKNICKESENMSALAESLRAKTPE